MLCCLPGEAVSGVRSSYPCSYRELICIASSLTDIGRESPTRGAVVCSALGSLRLVSAPDTAHASGHARIGIVSAIDRGLTSRSTTQHEDASRVACRARCALRTLCTLSFHPLHFSSGSAQIRPVTVTSRSPVPTARTTIHWCGPRNQGLTGWPAH